MNTKKNYLMRNLIKSLNSLPMQFLGPALNGTYANGCLSATLSGKNLSGSNFSGSG